MLPHKSEDIIKLKKWFDEGSWISCEVVQSGFEMYKTSRRNQDKKNESDSKISTTFEWLDGNGNNSLVLPYGENETFSSENEITVVDSEITKDSILLPNEFKEENKDLVTDLVDEDNGKLLPLFISHILRCKEYKKCFKLGNIFFKSVHIFGTVVSSQVTNKNKILVIDDGTAQIMCYIEDFINDSVAEGADDELNVDSSFYEVFKYVREQSIESTYTLPTFDKINLGDKVLITGDVSLHKGNYYIFVENIVRPKGNSCHIDFMKDIFNNYETGYYDF
ncbi:uncharacterized protein LOC123683813 [Harmonia axyridis]|uniref:uncharacterized protein LOC123683813 n=1 Tax=Harmonia axyridis TaxID=115357 RepID=UPI001E276269|nr:uncharacterized protein LOC123683813 [Harmonia axyridis]